MEFHVPIELLIAEEERRKEQQRHDETAQQALYAPMPDYRRVDVDFKGGKRDSDDLLRFPSAVKKGRVYDGVWSDIDVDCDGVMKRERGYTEIIFGPSDDYKGIIIVKGRE